MQGPVSPNYQQHPVQDASSKQQTKQKCKPSHQQTGLSPQPCTSEEKQNNLSTNLPITQITGPNLGGQKPKGRKNSTLKPGKRRPQTE